MPNARRQKVLLVAVCLALAAIVWLVFGQTLNHDFVNFDDDEYVYDNPQVANGLTWRGIGWAFTHAHSANWHPLTWISHMLDCQLYGLKPGGHHLTNVLLHTATTILLFLVLWQMTRLRETATSPTTALWGSAFVAAVFAIHPLRVESVAWIAERKDVLSGLFFMLTIAAYIRYARLPWSPGRYFLVALTLTLALMSKPMAVTLPLVLLLLDYWPLKRSVNAGGTSTPGRLIAEKIPLLVLCGAACAITLLAQQNAIAALPLSLRLANACVSYVVYLKQLFYPVGLAVYYPHPENGLALQTIVMAFLLLLTVSVGVVVVRRKQPWLMIGWLWYLVMLVPVIGILQVGSQAHADRYTYLSQMGLYVMLAGTAIAACSRWRPHQWVPVGLGAVAVAVLISCARTQTSYWRNGESLWAHTLACTSRNAVAHNNLGSALLQKGDMSEAIAHLQTALQLKSDYADAHVNFGNALLRIGKVNEAIAHYERALEIAPDEAGTHFNLGNALLRKRRVDEAIAHYRQAIATRPAYSQAHSHLGNALLQRGRSDEAIAQYQTALMIDPNYGSACNNLGFALLQKGKADEAIVQLRRALELNPSNPEARHNLTNALVQKRNMIAASPGYQPDPAQQK